jgi:hypothetical protein
VVDLGGPGLDRGAAETRRAGDHRDAAAAQRPCLRAGQQAPLPLIQVRRRTANIAASAASVTSIPGHYTHK